MSNMEDKFNQLLTQVKSYNDNPESIALIEKAWEFAKLAHADQKRDSGEIFLLHPLGTAMYLAEWKMDAVSVAAGLLHDTIDWGGAKYGDLQEEFGEEIAKLVDGVSRVSK